MRISLTPKPLEPIPVTTKFGTFRLCCRRPTDQELLMDVQCALRQEWAEQFDLRCRCITGWLDIEDEDGHPIAFSPSNLRTIRSKPEVLGAMAEALGRLFRESEPTEDEEKN